MIVRPEPGENNPLWNYYSHNKGRIICKWHHYFDIYHNQFARFRNQPLTILEIGVYKGGSLQMWKSYFGNQARIYGVDIDPLCKELEEDQIKILIGDQSDPDFLRKIMDEIGVIDILVDDGGHTMTQQVTTFNELYSAVSEFGVYLVEDLHTSYWEEYGGGYKKQGSFVEYAKDFIDNINAWHSHDPALTPGYLTKSSTGIDFYDSVLVIEKHPNSVKPKDSMTGYEPDSERFSDKGFSLNSSRTSYDDEVLYNEHLDITSSAHVVAVKTGLEEIWRRGISKTSDTCVILHLYYPIMWNEMVSYLTNLDNQFDLILTIPRELDISEREILSAFPNAQIFRCENLGRDVLPFLQAYSAIAHLGYKYICKIHTKRDVFPMKNVNWRRDMLDKLMGSPAIVSMIKKSLDTNPDWGMIAPKGYVVPHTVYWSKNAERVKELARGLFLPTDNLEFSYVIGTMFWFGPEVFASLTDANRIFMDFEPEIGQTDGALSHAYERFFGMVAIYSGYKIAESDPTNVKEADISVQLYFLAHHFVNQGKYLDSLKVELPERENAIQVLSVQLAETDQVIQSLSEQLVEKERFIQAQALQMVEKEHVIQSLSAQVIEKEEVIQSLSAQVLEKKR